MRGINRLGICIIVCSPSRCWRAGISVKTQTVGPKPGLTLPALDQYSFARLELYINNNANIK
jgi:hypothetical protein